MWPEEAESKPSVYIQPSHIVMSFGYCEELNHTGGTLSRATAPLLEPGGGSTICSGYLLDKASLERCSEHVPEETSRKTKDMFDGLDLECLVILSHELKNVCVERKGKPVGEL
ncbi:hypothetical protein WMY93_020110 [Mugilogobius chulae]|uniref:Uncharacterized protein n=1 Tax=Mugilogobius chulae TaxID=88201 RepID=A0AAW0NL24_9GOBI